MINVALLGFGRIGQMHAQNIHLNKNLRLLYIYEKIEKLRKPWISVENHGKPWKINGKPWKFHGKPRKI